MMLPTAWLLYDSSTSMPIPTSLWSSFGPAIRDHGARPFPKKTEPAPQSKRGRFGHDPGSMRDDSPQVSP